ncbi:MAG TPA: hypothetical protein VFQ41_01715 [Candidatus Angelobacter sp.]|nr:hypothetical protein [Candidatus Angelobacter sp.]
MELNHEFTEEQIFLYLLGRLGEPERTVFEKRYFADPLFFEHINALEDHFIDIFLQKKMSWWKRRQFKTYYLRSPLRRQKAALALSLMQAALQETRISRPEAPSFFAARGKLGVLLASTAISVVAASFIVNVALWRSLTELQARNARIQKEQHAALALSVVRVPLEPGNRGPEPGMERADVPAGAQVIQLELDAKGLDAASRYQATLQDASGEILLRQGHLPVQQAHGNAFILLPVNAGILLDSDYLVLLEREDGERRFPVASYGLALSRR